MSRLPQLEQELLEAAERADARLALGAAPDRQRSGRWRRRAPLLAAMGGLLVSGAAVAAVTGILQTGDPVPASTDDSGLAPVAASRAFTLAAVRTPDPRRGPAWGVGLYQARAKQAPTNAPPDIVRQFRSTLTCVVVGRVQRGRLGVVGRDGVFNDDGRFHPLSPASQSSSQCGGRAKDGSFFRMGFGPPIPASGYTGRPGTAIGGCRERVNLDGPTVSPQTRRRLQGVPQCAATSMRRVVAGFAGPHATTATLTAPGYRKTARLDPAENGAYLFVIASTSARPPDLTITTQTGKPCRPFAPRRHTANGRLTLPQAAKNCNELTDPIR